MERLSEHSEGRRWLPWLTNLFRRRDFEVVWDGTSKGWGQTGNGVPQGSPLSPVLLLIWMAPIMEDLERKASVSMGRDVEVFSYVDDIHIGVYGRSQCEEEEQGGWVERVNEVVGEVSREWGMPTAPDKHERLVIRSSQGRKKRRGGETKWGLSLRGWRQVYTGMIRTVVTWGAELGWRGQKRWAVELESLQYDSLPKCVGALAVKVASKEKVRKIAGVERMSTYLYGGQARFVARVVEEKYMCGMLWEGELQ